MASHIQHIVIVTKPNSPTARALGEEIAAWLHGLKKTAHVLENPFEHDAQRCLLTSKIRELNPAPQLVLSLGGDGTLLSVARKMPDKTVPILGLNLGQLGFLTELTTQDWKEKLNDIFTEGPAISERLALVYEQYRPSHSQDTPLHAGRVVNDIVITRGGLARLVNMELFVDGEHVGLLRADGLIVSTPTGSTGYSVSARGPLVHPDTSAISITPICPFLHEFRPMVLPGEADICVEILGETAEIFLTMDGQEGYPLESGDLVRVRRAETGLYLLKPKSASYFQKLKTKGFIREHDYPKTVHGCTSLSE